LVEGMADDLARTATQPEFLEMIQAVQRAPVPKKFSLAKDVARLEHVASMGIRVPDTFRITTRTFEDSDREDARTREPSGRPRVTLTSHSGSVAFRGVVVTVSEKGPTPEVISPETVKAQIKGGLEAIGRFVRTQAFKQALAELAEIPAEAREKFVATELLDHRARKRRGIVLPDGMHIQRSQFADGRPTLFCVSMALALAYPWHKVTITFDNA
jgi:hypothetical protein